MVDPMLSSDLRRTPPRAPHAPPPSSWALNMERAFLVGSLVDAGERHLRRRQGGQDHALALRLPSAVVLAVADGAGVVDGAVSRTEVGAGLVVELAARAAADAAARGMGPGDARHHVAGILVRHLLPLWVMLGEGAAGLLHCTLMLAVSTPSWTSIWSVGDGAWGATGSLAHGFASPATIATVACYGAQWHAHGRERRARLRTSVALLCRRGDPDEVAAGLQPVLEAEGPTLRLYVASDGLEDEPRLDAWLRVATWQGDELAASLDRPAGSDDLALAWAHERWPGSAGLAADAQPLPTGNLQPPEARR
ncbi:protein phosphatase 2C domain-containing protein [Nannocystis exedens]|uniref:protein phosphatase 2C domain-containing protein n=1 Tax=Nannocystis exedens TaxID=54 RepID=UPI000BBA0B25|nr:protein phosphatase 2C domain-containing protein [Nannocystis exedens]PCC66453.1 hypothetical protein NAEX_09041 [Nannocystis exedens]